MADPETTTDGVPGDAEWRVDLALPADLSAPKTARDAIRSSLDDVGEDALDDVMLIVSELVSNAVQHGRPEILLRARANPLSIDVSVLDHGTHVPARSVAHPDSSATSGRGLAIVDTLAESWGIEPLVESRGKRVWATLDRGSDAAG